MIYEMLVKPHTFQNSANLNEEEISTINATFGSGSTASPALQKRQNWKPDLKQEERKCCDR
jgi:hypothetical protein